MYKRYQGNTGRCERIDEPWTNPTPEPGPALREPAQAPQGPTPGKRAPGQGPGLSGELGRLLGRLAPARLETEDLLLLALLYLLYRECGDKEFLLAIAAYIFL